MLFDFSYCDDHLSKTMIHVGAFHQSAGKDRTREDHYDN